MTYNFHEDDDYRQISSALEADGVLLKDAWFIKDGQKWHPALVTERNTGIRGFDVKPNSKRGRADLIGRKKIRLDDFLLLLAKKTSSSTEEVRCQLPKGGSKDSKPIKSLKFSERLQQLLTRVRVAP